jgi:hypothetical protein
MELLSTARKAVLAFVVTLSGSLGVAFADNACTYGEAAIAVAAAFAAYGAVYGVTNKP